MYVTLSISATSISVLSVSGQQVKKWGNAPLEPELVRDGLILQPKAVGEAISALFNKLDIPKKQAATSLTGLSFTYRILSLPQMKPALLEEAIQRGARKEIPLTLEELYLSWQAIGARDGEQDFFVLGIPRNLVDALAETLAEAEIKPRTMELKPLVLARAANRADALIVALEPDCFDIILVANGIPSIMHTITPREAASIEDNIQRLTDELSKTVQFYNSNHPENPLTSATPLLLTGELSLDATTSNLIQAEIEHPVELLVPPLKFTPDLPVASYATNMGLALREVLQKRASDGDTTHFHDLNLNILPDKYRAGTHRELIQLTLPLLALVTTAGFLFPMYQTKNQADAETMLLQTELSEASHELRQASLASSEAKQIEDTINEIAADVETLQREYEDILSKSSDSTNSLQLVTDALPPAASFTSMNIDAYQITVVGEADNPFTVIDYVTALEAQVGSSAVRIAELGEAEGSGVSFTVVISKQD